MSITKTTKSSTIATGATRATPTATPTATNGKKTVGGGAPSRTATGKFSRGTTPSAVPSTATPTPAAIAHDSWAGWQSREAMRLGHVADELAYRLKEFLAAAESSGWFDSEVARAVDLSEELNHARGMVARAGEILHCKTSDYLVALSNEETEEEA